LNNRIKDQRNAKSEGNSYLTLQMYGKEKGQSTDGGMIKGLTQKSEVKD
jgi:hypothetical protein